jgi:hypothetical protein
VVNYEKDFEGDDKVRQEVYYPSKRAEMESRNGFSRKFPLNFSTGG